MNAFESPPATVEQFLQSIAREYDGLSKRLKLIARCVETHCDHLGLVGVRELSEQWGVHPSAVVRFAKHFGFSGYLEMQRLFREKLIQENAPGRVERRRSGGKSDLDGPDAADIVGEVLEDSIAGMRLLHKKLDPAALRHAIAMLAEADTIWVAGAGQSFAMAVYLEHALRSTDKRVGSVNAFGSMPLGQTRSVRSGDVLVAISFVPDVEETLQVVQHAVKRGARLIAITDSRMSPLVCLAEATLVVPSSTTFGSRAIAVAMAFAQSVFLALSGRLARSREFTISAQ